MGSRLTPRSGARCAVVGAGYAGMAAAVTLAQRDIPVTVFEAGSVPGGRARRVLAQGHELDNGQHILVGAYSELFRLMRTVGVPAQALLRLPLELRYADGFSFRSLWFAAPLGLLAGLLALRGAPFAERVRAISFVLKMKRHGFRLQPDIPVKELLTSERQNGQTGHYLWGPLCVSALNTPVELASANAFLAVLRDALLGPDGASDLLLPRVDLSRLFPEPAAEFVRSRGGEIRLRESVSDAADLKKDFSLVIVAVGPHQLKSILPENDFQYSYQPIYTCYLQYPERTQLPFPMLGLSGGLVQWVFDRGVLLGERGRLACVISAQGEHQQMSRDEIAGRCDRELREAIGGLPPAQWSRVIAEKRATVTCAPGVQRPGTETQIPGVYLAGDYTDPEYPPTLEAAVRSGVRAARAALDTIND